MNQTKFDKELEKVLKNKELEKVLKNKELEKVLKNKSLITFPDGCKYTGMTKKDPKDNKKLIPHGLGFAIWPDKQSYKGQYKNGTFDGWGHYTTPGSQELIGIWKAGFLSKGEMKMKNGQHYVGDFKKSKFHGTGTMNYSGNYKYEGQWKDNYWHGKGKLIFLKDFEDDEKGTVISGIFTKSVMNGNFEKVYADGEIMECVFLNDKCTKAKFKDQTEWRVYK